MKLGQKIGEGKFRAVYEHPSNPDWVIKVLAGYKQDPSQNRIEWMVWQAVKDTNMAKHFCPCVELTDDEWLVMVRCEPALASRGKRLRLLGVTLRDTKKRANLGVLNDRTVVVDYGCRSFLEFLDRIKS